MTQEVARRGQSVRTSEQTRTLGKFQLVAVIGQGGMAKVYLALMAGPAGFNKLMVLKVLREDALAGADEAVVMFWDEARLAAQMVHPNIVHTYEVGQEGDDYYMAMEYLDGQTYRNAQLRCAQHGGMPLAEHLRILAATARGLHHAHELRAFNGQALGVVHRDVSPQNVFVTYDGQVKLLDFGIAKARGAGSLTQVGVIKGKFDYIAPEQLRGDALDGRADVFALGVMLWEAVTGVRFAGGRTVPEVAKAHARLQGSEPNVRSVAADVPEALAVIIDRAIALEPGARFGDAAAFADAVEAYLEDSGARPSAKSLSALLGPLFADERATMQRLIDQQVQRSRSGISEFGDNTGSLPRWRTSVSPSQTPPLVAGREPAKRRPSVRGRMVAVALTVAAGGALAMLSDPSPKSVRPSDGVMATSQAASARVDGAASSAPRSASAERVLVNISVTPASARVTLDERPIPTSFSGEFLPSSHLHHVEVTAPGHRAQRRTISFEKNRVVRIALESLSARVPARRGPQPRAPEAEREVEASAVSVAPSAVAQPVDPATLLGEDMVAVPRAKRGEIDVSDPYAAR